MTESAAVTAALPLYHSLIEESKRRLTFVRDLLSDSGSFEELPRGYYNAEQCYLQIRLVCELVALGVLTLHEPLGSPKKLLKEWHAQDLLRELFKINPDGFPQAAEFERLDGSSPYHLSNRETMTPERLFEVYNACGAALHRGVLKHLLSRKPRNYDLVSLQLWVYELTNVLSKHRIVLPGQNLAVAVDWSGGQDGHAMVLLGEAFDFETEELSSAS